MSDTDSTTKAPSWRDCLSVHLLADDFPMMEPDELRALGEDISKNGLKTDIAIWLDQDGRPHMLDGRNRLAAMHLVGLLPSPTIMQRVEGRGKSQRLVWHIKPYHAAGPAGASIAEGEGLVVLTHTDDPAAYVRSLNIHRRHLKPKVKRDLIAKLLVANPERSDREIAKETKSSPTTVGNKRKRLEATGAVSKLDTRTGKGGRKQRVKRRRAVGPDSDRLEAAERPPVMDSTEEGEVMPTPPRTAQTEQDISHQQLASESAGYRALLDAWQNATSDDRQRFMAVIGAKFEHVQVMVTAEGETVPVEQEPELTEGAKNQTKH